MALKKHLRKTFIAGILAAAPLVATVLLVWWVEATTRQPLREIGWNIPFLGVLIAVLLIYLLGLVVSSLVGKWCINRIDAILSRLPLLSELYQAWKHISVTPGGREGMFSRVVLVPADGGIGSTIGFSSGEALEGAPGTCCVFIPAAPNPMNGRLIFVPLADCTMLQTSAEEAFKWILSGGNYVPAEVGPALRQVA
jgi:uncharacterized membrane protein